MEDKTRDAILQLGEQLKKENIGCVIACVQNNTNKGTTEVLNCMNGHGSEIICALGSSVNEFAKNAKVDPRTVLAMILEWLEDQGCVPQDNDPNEKIRRTVNKAAKEIKKSLERAGIRADVTIADISKFGEGMNDNMDLAGDEWD